MPGVEMIHSEAPSATSETDSPYPFDVTQAIAAARSAQRYWRRQPVRTRLKAIAALRAGIAADPICLAQTCGRLNQAESLSAEVLPLADACRFLQKTAEDTLRPQSVSRKGRPAWLRYVQVEQRREPFGVVLIVAPSNYSLMLPGIQALHALVAGNAVLWKPAEGHSEPARLLKRLLVNAGLDERLLQVLAESTESVEAAVCSGVDRVVLTGSADTGRAVQRLLAEELVPSTMELSGCDAMFVTTTADLQRAAKCLWFGLRLNHGQTCIAPRRIFVDSQIVDAFIEELRIQRPLMLPETPASHDQSPAAAVRAAALVDEALDAGATLLFDGIRRENRPAVAEPTLLGKVSSDMRISREDIFAPVASLLTYQSIDEAAALNEECPYALGATIFGSETAEVRDLIQRIEAGCVVVNDMIVPSADSRVAFSGRKQSGFGATRGSEGLEQMTQLKVVIRQTGSWLPHLNPDDPQDAELITQLIQTLHSRGLVSRITHGFGLLRTAMTQGQSRKRSGKE